ncbi:uncharacterized protein LOC133820020 [Humulus lupulus]|uniref:uncharacterized protein LOC133820020 n=1 Tax=Humulus lupulus TaxID=3486 RepID=UPI002B404E9F|nr:uncharacterized protein LOC133820020 [Humulus lupulus]
MAMVIHEAPRTPTVRPQELDPRTVEESGAEPVEEIKEVEVMEEPLRKLKVGKSLQNDVKERLIRFLKDNLEVFAWSYEDMLKEHLGKPSLLEKPEKGEKLYLYLAVSEHAVSATLVKGEKKHQRPVYYISKRLVDAENRYPEIEKLAYALVVASRKLRTYFHVHAIEVLTNSPLRQVLHKPDTSGRLVKWSIELSQFDIVYTPRASINGQVLADFIVEFTSQPNGGRSEEEGQSVAEEETRSFEGWSLHVDGASNEGGSRAGIVMTGPKGLRMYCAIQFRFEASNNEAEYEALLAGLRLAQGLKVTHLHIFSDSQLLILREKNTHADALAKLASTRDGDTLESVPVEYLPRPSITNPDVHMVNAPKESWASPIIDYLKDGVVPTDKREARRLVYKAARYTLVDGVLYKRGFSVPLLRCVDEEEAMKVQYEIHEGECGNHASGPSTARKAMRQGYYWPSMERDANDFARKCDKCQRHANYP